MAVTTVNKSSDEELAAGILNSTRRMIEERLKPFTRGDQVLGSAVAGYIGQGALPAVPVSKMVPALTPDPLLANQQLRVATAGDAMETVDVAAMDAAAKITAWMLFM